MRNFNNTSNNTCQSGHSAHLERSFVSSSEDDAKNTMKGKSKFFSFTRICTFSLLVLMSKCYENGNSNSSVCTFNGFKNGAGLKSLRMLGSAESKEDQLEGASVENEYEEGTKVEEETENCPGEKNCEASDESSSSDSNANDKTCQTNCGACTCGFKTLDLYFEKKLLDILDAGNKKAEKIVDASTHVFSGLKNYLKYVLLFSPLLLELLAGKLLLAGYYKSSQFVSSVCVSFYLYVFYKIIQHCALERGDGYLAYENYSSRRSPFRWGYSGRYCVPPCTGDVCPRSSAESHCNKGNGSCSKKEDSECTNKESKSSD
ncbi:Uncharacterized protein PCOAH_00040550 [Plasmodium coatneyi]|uniref:Uncharacterized protein n=1 Tax=Plasmodium coatneyi TaxID=208452 RepID=A0A1B1E429_9APIC|nr:Uncharacterized protein PCOAH_00040550 [Plasmodium coatneyi]ANQ09768.1 Uncharacterized protein PCOAH_00040550 [Plasmodium coatneyi]